MEIINSESQKSEPEPRIIGLTGGIGSGKSTVAKFIEEMGYPIYFSDLRAKEIVNEDPQLKERIIALLGENTYQENGLYNRKYVSSQVFENPLLLNELNAIIHPAVKKDFERWINSQIVDVVFKETALLFELGLEKECAKSLLVTAEDNMRIKRVMDRDDKTYREVEKIMANQLPEKDKVRITDYVIHNNGSLEELEVETLSVVQQIIEQLE